MTEEQKLYSMLYGGRLSSYTTYRILCIVFENVTIIECLLSACANSLHVSPWSALYENEVGCL